MPFRFILTCNDCHVVNSLEIEAWSDFVGFIDWCLWFAEAAKAQKADPRDPINVRCPSCAKQAAQHEARPH